MNLLTVYGVRTNVSGACNANYEHFETIFKYLLSTDK